MIPNFLDHQFQRLEATLNQFNGATGQVGTFAQETQLKMDELSNNLADGREDQSLLSIPSVESSIHECENLSSQIDTRTLRLAALEPLVAELARGGHRQAEGCQTILNQLQGDLGSLSESNGKLREELELELARQRQIDSLLKDAALQETRLETYLAAVEAHVNAGAVESGCGVGAVQTRLDQLHADHHEMEGTLKKIFFYMKMFSFFFVC